MKRYLSLIPLDDAITLACKSFPVPARTETVPLAEALERILAEPVFAGYPVPEANLSAMDGIAVRCADTIAASEQNPLALPSAARVNTGNVVPSEYDAVIMIEEVWQEPGRYIIRKPAVRSQNVRSAGEDIRKNEMILPAGHHIRPFDIGALATYGIASLKVRALSIGIIPTGGELVPLGTRPVPGHVVDSNSLMIASYLREFGVSCTRYPITPDDSVLIGEAIRNAARDHDVVLVSAGSSAGTRDYTEQVIREQGTLLFHGIAMKPGKPAMLGSVEGKPVFGLPGYPLSTRTVLQELVIPVLEVWGFRRIYRYDQVPVILGHRLVSDLMTDEFVYLSVGRIACRYVGISQPRAAAGQMAGIRSNARLRIPAAMEGMEEGAQVTVQLNCDRLDLENALMLTGSYDPALDQLARFMREAGRILYPKYTGNLEAVQALRKDICHAAPLVMPAGDTTGPLPYLFHYLRGLDIIFAGIAAIPLGIISRDGIRLEELSSVQFINQEKGSVARQVADELIGTWNIPPSMLSGYEREVKNHRAVARAVRYGTADAGIASAQIADEAGLRFTPISVERYVLAFRKEQLADSRVEALFDLICSPRFRDALKETGGYDLGETGVIRVLSAETGEMTRVDRNDAGVTVPVTNA